MDCFKFFDKKEAGKINAEAFKLMLGEQGISQVEIDEFIADAKIDKNGEIDYMAYAKRVAEGEVEKKVEPKNKFSTMRKKWNSCKQFKIIKVSNSSNLPNFEHLVDDRVL